MSYRNPRFTVNHELRDHAGAGVVHASSSTISAATPVERLWDERAGGLIEADAAGAFQVRFDRRTMKQGNMQGYNRFLIPKGHNQIGEEVQIQRSVLGDWSDGSLHTGNVKGFINVIYDPDDLLQDYEWDEIYNGYGILVRPEASVKAQLGEFWVGTVMQPTTGVAHQWDDEAEPNLAISTTRAGNAYPVELGEPRRRFTLEHRMLTGADLQLYDEIFRRTRNGARPFWYEHPDSGNARVILNDCSDLSDFSTPDATATFAQVTGVDGIASSGLRIIPSASVGAKTVDLVVANWNAGVTDLNGYVLEYATQSETDGTLWIDEQSGRHEVRGQGNRESHWSFSKALFTSKRDGFWHVHQFDLNNPQSSKFVIANIGADGPADLSNPTELRWQFTTTASSGQELLLDEIALIKKSSMPVLVEMLEYERFQDSPAPAAGDGPTFTIRMTMREVLS